MKRAQPRSKRRQDERRQIMYILKSAPPQRHKMPSDKLAELIHCVKINRVASFGLKSIHLYHLDDEFCLEETELDATLARVFRSTDTCGSSENFRINLLCLATYLNRDHIVSALLRAGANPAAYPACHFPESDTDQLDGVSDKVRRYFQNEDLTPANLIWIAKYYISSMVEAQRVKQVCVCHSCGQKTLCVNLNPCEHFECKQCFWSHVSTIANIHSDYFCPVCSTTLLHNNAWLPASLPDPQPTVLSSGRPADIKSSSLAKWEQLPVTEDVSCVGKRPPLSALPLSQSVRKYLGNSREQRVANLFKAVMTRNVLRVQALVEAGVDVNARNEYSQTPLLVALWMNYEDVARLLLRCGAGVDGEDFMGNSYAAWACRQGLRWDTFNDHSSAVFYSACPPLASSLTGSQEVSRIPFPASNDDSENALVIDGAFSSLFTDALLGILRDRLTLAPREKLCSSDRAYICDMDTSIGDSLGQVIADATRTQIVEVFPHMRYLVYSESGGSLAPHIDLSKTAETDPSQGPALKSTHTFVLYLTDCERGGCTTLLRSVKGELSGDNVMSAVSPVRGRLLVFPHSYPHAGQAVESVPKILLRGEVYVIN